MVICVIIVTWDPFYQHGLISPPTWKNYRMASKLSNGIIYQFLNFIVEVKKMDKWFNTTLYNNYLHMLGLKLTHVSKRNPGILLISRVKSPETHTIWTLSTGCRWDVTCRVHPSSRLVVFCRDHDEVIKWKYFPRDAQPWWFLWSAHE